jgi:ribosomal protein S18 acetylase RimI-like enzyme
MYSISSDFDFKSMQRLLKHNENSILGKYAYDRNIPPKTMLENISSNIEELMHENVTRLALLNSQRTIDGILLLKKADYDSAHFGLNIARLELALFNPRVKSNDRQYLFQRLRDEANSQNLNLIFARVGLEQLPIIQSLEKIGAILADILLTFYFNVRNEVILSPTRHFEIGKAAERDKFELVKMSRKVFRINHFHADPLLSKRKADELYAKWMANCLKGSVDKVLVAKKGNEVLGFITCRIERVGKSHRYGVIDLIGVKDEYIGKGIGLTLVYRALEWFSKSTNSIYVGTQAANLPAVKLYEKAGFDRIYSEADLHLWPTVDKSARWRARANYKSQQTAH